MTGKITIDVPFHQLLHALGEAVDKIAAVPNAGRIFAIDDAAKLEAMARDIRECVSKERYFWNVARKPCPE